MVKRRRQDEGEGRWWSRVDSWWTEDEEKGAERKKAGQESCEDPIIGGYCGIITLAAAGSGLSKSWRTLFHPPVLIPSPSGCPRFTADSTSCDRNCFAASRRFIAAIPPLASRRSPSSSSVSIPAPKNVSNPSWTLESGHKPFDRMSEGGGGSRGARSRNYHRRKSFGALFAMWGFWCIMSSFEEYWLETDTIRERRLHEGTELGPWKNLRTPSSTHKFPLQQRQDGFWNIQNIISWKLKKMRNRRFERRDTESSSQLSKLHFI